MFGYDLIVISQLWPGFGNSGNW